MFQWFILFPEFTEFPFNLEKTPKGLRVLKIINVSQQVYSQLQW